jgi:lysyl endopeptidase
MRIRKILTGTFALALAALAFAGGNAWAQSNTSAFVRETAKSVVAESMRLPPGAPRSVLVLEEVDAGQVSAIRHANTLAGTKSLQIGIGRSVEGHAPAQSRALQWTPLREGYAAQWQVTSPGASALRIALVADRMPAGVELRFAGNGDDVVYGPVGAQELRPGDMAYWTPVLEGDTATIELFAADFAATRDASLAIALVSHLFASPTAAHVERLAKAAQFCEIDIICRSASNAELAQAARAVARMTFTSGVGGGTFLCTGTLLNPTSGGITRYFYSANHCISTQASASTLTTHWFDEVTTCGGTTRSPNYVQVPGGATLLYNNRASDGLLLRLNNSPPPGAVLAGWDASTLVSGTALTAIHHPAGDFKKVSLGTFGGFGTSSLASGSFTRVNWNSITTGITEGGSSGSGIFSNTGSGYQLRGGLLGGPSSCTAPASQLYDQYSRLDQVYPFIAQYINPSTTSCNYSVSPSSAFIGSAGGSGSFSLASSSGCGWSATSDASWLTTTSSGSGSGTVTYSVAANSGTSGRTGTITVGGQAFVVTQGGHVGIDASNAVANGGFEGGPESWAQSGLVGEIVTNDAASAHSGNWYGWLGGYNDGLDVLTQNVSIPAGSGPARLQFWYEIGTQETLNSRFDTLTVSIVNPSSGAILATLASFSNLDATGGWVQSAAYDLTAFRGQTVQLQFRAVTDFSELTSFRVDDIVLSAQTASTSANYTSLWWNAAESGWGINFNQQGDILFGTLFTYDAGGSPMWLVMSGATRQGTGDAFSGDLYSTTGPPFNAVPFTPIGAANLTRVGTMSVSFSSTDRGTLTYSVNGANVTKSIEKQVYGARAANCAPTSDTQRTTATNYQDLWWNAAESGWGINFTHQADILFGTLFTYSATAGQGNGRPGLWLVMSAGVRQSDGSYLGDLYRTTGPAFNAVPFTPIGAGNLTRVGSMRVTFSNGNAAVLQYDVNGASITKNITRQVFSSPVPLCTS